MTYHVTYSVGSMEDTVAYLNELDGLDLNNLSSELTDSVENLIYSQKEYNHLKEGLETLNRTRSPEILEYFNMIYETDYRNYDAALEGVGESLKNAFNSIVEWLKKVWNACFGWIYKFDGDGDDSVKKTIDALEDNINNGVSVIKCMDKYITMPSSKSKAIMSPELMYSICEASNLAADLLADNNTDITAAIQPKDLNVLSKLSELVKKRIKAKDAASIELKRHTNDKTILVYYTNDPAQTYDKCTDADFSKALNAFKTTSNNLKKIRAAQSQITTKINSLTNDQEKLNNAKQYATLAQNMISLLNAVSYSHNQILSIINATKDIDENNTSNSN